MKSKAIIIGSNKEIQEHPCIFISYLGGERFQPWTDNMLFMCGE